MVRLLQNRHGDAQLRDRFGQDRRVHAPALIDAEVASAIRGLLTSKPAIKVGIARAEEMLDDFAELPHDREYARAAGHHAVIEACPEPPERRSPD